MRHHGLNDRRPPGKSHAPTVMADNGQHSVLEGFPASCQRDAVLDGECGTTPTALFLSARARWKAVVHNARGFLLNLEQRCRAQHCLSDATSVDRHGHSAGWQTPTFSNPGRFLHADRLRLTGHALRQLLGVGSCNTLLSIVEEHRSRPEPCTSDGWDRGAIWPRRFLTPRQRRANSTPADVCYLFPDPIKLSAFATIRAEKGKMMKIRTIWKAVTTARPS